MNASSEGQTLLYAIELKNYKSIAYCRLKLRRLTVLVGPNGAGKSNFLDALRLVADALRTTLEHALRERGGIKEVRRRSRGHPTHFEIKLWWALSDNTRASYGFKVGALPNGGFKIQREECEIDPNEIGKPMISYAVEGGILTSSTLPLNAKVEPDRLFLTTVSALPEFRPLYDAITGMGFYNLNPETMRDLQSPDAGEILLRDGSNLASVLGRLQALDKASAARIEEYLSSVVPGIRGVDAKSLGHKETVEFRQQVSGDENPWRFLAANMSDGTLRALGILVALHQRVGPGGKPATVIGVEEPESALHPGAAAALSDALIEASHHVQVIATSHSPDLLDNKEIDPRAIIAVTAAAGETKLAPTDENTRRILKDRLMSAGDLLRSGQLQPDPKAIARQLKQSVLFGGDDDD